MSAPDMFDILTRLENQIINMQGAADILHFMATSENFGNGSEALAYLANRLAEHHRAAREAFDEIFEATKPMREVKQQ